MASSVVIPTIIGLLFGTNINNEIYIYDAADAVFEHVNGEFNLNCIEIEKIKTLLSAVYPNYVILGWYTIATEVLPFHLTIHRSMKAFNNSPLFLIINQLPPANSQQLPLSIFETEIHHENYNSAEIFVEVQFRLNTTPAERVAVDQITKSPVEGVSSLEGQNDALSVSLLTLQSKLDIIIKFLKCIKNNEIAVDHSILRKAQRICSELPNLNSKEFNEAFLEEVNECLMVSYMSAVTKSTNDLNVVAELFSKISVDRSSSKTNKLYLL